MAMIIVAFAVVAVVGLIAAAIRYSNKAKRKSRTMRREQSGLPFGNP
jgi:Tfp pilus assembly protein PilV